MFDALTRLAQRRFRFVLIGAFFAFILAGAFGGSLADRLPPSDSFIDPGSDSSKAGALFEDVAGFRAAPGVLVLVKTPEGARSVEGLRRVRAITRRIKKDPGVRLVADLRDGDKQVKQNKKDGEKRDVTSFVSRDGKLTYIAVFAAPDAEESDIGLRLQQAFAGQSDITVGGPGPGARSIGDQVVADLGASEKVAFPILFVLMLWVFRGVIAALLPLFVGGITIVITLAILRLINAEVPLSIFALNLTVAMGLGLAIDYSLFVVSRYREELAKGLAPDDAISQTLHTAGRTVFVSSLTVAAALVALMVFPQQFLYSMAISGSITALVASAVSLVALPALLRALGTRVNSLAPKRWQHAREKEASGFWYRLSHWVMGHAVFVTVAVSAALLVIGSPFLGVKFTGIDTSVLPDGNVAKTIDTTLRTQFANAATEPISIVVSQVPDDAAGKDSMEKYADKIQGLANVKSVSRPNALSITQVWQFDVTAKTKTLEPPTLQLIRDIRAVKSPGPSLVAGQTARFVDQNEAIGAGLPFALAIIGCTTFVILFLMTGSLLLPIKSLIMNVLGISAAFGLLVFIFQDGRLEGLLDYHSQGGLESTQPLLLLALAFGLSTDYGVFLLTRIKEGRDHGLSNEEAVALGIQRTGRIITAAAMLFCVTIGAFAASKIIFIKEVGIGTAAAVIIDATLVRALLVPALMRLLGEWNWWAPAPLRRLHGKLGIDESAPELPPERLVELAAPLAPPPRPPEQRPL